LRGKVYPKLPIVLLVSLLYGLILGIAIGGQFASGVRECLLDPPLVSTLALVVDSSL
jgi:hypothetical protein